MKPMSKAIYLGIKVMGQLTMPKEPRKASQSYSISHRVLVTIRSN